MPLNFDRITSYNVCYTKLLRADTIEYETPSTQQTASKFNGTGNHTVYNINQKIEWHGFFVKGKLYNGTHYIYNNNGDLLEKEVWENGVIVRTDKSNTL